MRNYVDIALLLLKRFWHRYHVRITTYGIMVLIATLFWLLKVLDNNYISIIKYPVHFHNFPPGLQLIGNPPDQLNLKVEAHGFTLLRYQLSPTTLPADIYINEYPLSKLPGSDSRYYLITDYFSSKVARQLSDKINIIEIKPDTVFFTLSAITSRKVPVIARVKYKTQMPYQSRDVICNPDSITISGPEFILDTLSKVYTEKYNMGTLTGNFGKKINLELPDLLQSSRKSVYTEVLVDKYTETSLQVPVTKVNVPDSLRMLTFPDVVLVKFLVPVNRFDDVKSFQFKITASCPATEDRSFSLQPRVQLRLEEQPAFVRNVRFTPHFADYLLKKK